MEKGIRILARPPAGSEGVLSAEALASVERLQRDFQPKRGKILERCRQVRRSS